MISHDDLPGLALYSQIVHFASIRVERFEIREEPGCGRFAHCHNDFRIDQFDLTLKERTAGHGFGFFRRGVQRRTALQRVENTQILLAVEFCCFKDLIEQFARGADKGLSQAVFFCARRFSDQHQPAGRVALSENRMQSAGRDFAGTAVLNELL